jgi:glycosyltransferase involved in cell wall biosynthesis
VEVSWDYVVNMNVRSNASNKFVNSTVNNSFPAKIINLDLANGFPTQPLTSEGYSAYIVFWWRGIPLGHQHIRRDAMPLPPSQLRNLALRTITPTVGAYIFEKGFEPPLPEYQVSRSATDSPDLKLLLTLTKPLQTLERKCQMEGNASLSVIICTRDRAESLERCLRSLLDCSHQAEEIVVVDNCPSSDATRQLIEQYPQVRYVLEPMQGLDVARNTGIRNSRGQIIAFVDDDVTVHPDWIARLAACFSYSQVMAVTGLVLAAELETEAQWLFEQYWGFNRGYSVLTYDWRYFEKLKQWGVPAWNIGAGANMAFRREVFDQIGYFDVRLDVGAAGCSGDSELWYRLLASGLTCRYEPKAVAFHHHRREMTELKKQLYYYMRGHTTALLIQFAKHKHWGNLLRLFILLPLHYLRRIALGIRRGFHGRQRTIVFEVAGCLSGLFYFLRNINSHPNM